MRLSAYLAGYMYSCNNPKEELVATKNAEVAPSSR